MNNLLRDPKIAHNVVQKESCCSSSRELSLPSSTGHQANKFGQLVNTNKHSITTIIQRKARYKVHGPTRKPFRRDRQGC